MSRPAHSERELSSLEDTFGTLRGVVVVSELDSLFMATGRPGDEHLDGRAPGEDGQKEASHPTLLADNKSISPEPEISGQELISSFGIICAILRHL